MKKPLHLLTAEEKVELMKELRKDAEGEELFPGVLVNKNSFFVARPVRAKKPAPRKAVKASA